MLSLSVVPAPLDPWTWRVTLKKKTSTAMQKVQFQAWKITLCSISLQKRKQTKTENCFVWQIWELAIQDLEVQDLACQINVLKIQD